MAANVDSVLIISSLKSPPFRPRFLDRVLISARWNQIEPVIVVNKADYPMNPQDRDRIKDYQEKHTVVICSAKTGRGIAELKDVLAKKRAVLVGQSGAGKSSIINRLNPDLGVRTGEISEKYNRGKHTTNYAVLLEWQEDSEIIDTPGIREIDLNGIPDENIRDGFIEFAGYSDECGFSTCSHIHEPDCAVRKAVDQGVIHPDRYQSYINIINERYERYER
jgi:ribosome biogenesis GTPase